MALLRVLLLVQVSAEPTGDPQEAFGRRSCKFRPLPESLSDGYATARGYEVSETFGVPLAVLLGRGHELRAQSSDGSLLGFSVQLPAAAPLQLLVEATVGQRSLKCTHTWGAGGHMKQCSLTRIQLQGPLLLKFRGLGQGQALTTSGPAACVTLRLDLEIASHEASEAARRCSTSEQVPAAPPLLAVAGTGQASVPQGSFSSPAPNGIIWKTALPAASPGDFNRLYARLSFPSMVHPLRILIEELQPWTPIGDEPRCQRRCFTGTAVSHGQVVQRLLPPALPFALWILSDDHDGSGIAGGHCANYDFELTMGPVPVQKMAQEFLGEPAWLCEGGAWPARLEQGEGAAEPTVLRQRRFRLRDIFDLTRPQATGMHILEIQVSEPSIFRLTSHRPSVPARPMLVPGRGEQAWLALAKPSLEIFTRRIPAAGREFRHSISTELQPGEYTLLFVTEMATGGLRPCASIMLSLLLEPLAPQSACGSDAGNGILDLQAMAEPLPLSAWKPSPQSFMVTLPRPAGSFEEGAGDAQGLQIIARSSMNLGYSVEPSAPPVLLYAKVMSAYSLGDLQVTFYENGQPLGEPTPLPDGEGYTAMAGPVVKDGFYEVVLFHVPRTPSTRTSCVEFSVELAAVSLSPPTQQGANLLPLPGSETCWLAPSLPGLIRVRDGETTVVEGSFQLPSHHSLQILASSDVLVRVNVASDDAEVRVGQEPLPFLGLAEDRFFYTGPALAIQLRARGLRGICPQLRLHLTALPVAAEQGCSQSMGLQGLGQLLTDALTSSSLRSVQAQLAAMQDAVTVPLVVASATAELRIELAIEAPWLPLELLLLRDGQEEKPWARGRHSGQRLVMLLPNLPQGSYKLKLGFWASMPRDRCAMVLGTVALRSTQGRDTSNYRQEMLDLPELLAVQSPPQQLLPGWLERSGSGILASEVYAVPAGGASTVQLRVPRKSMLRLVAEPTNILAPRLLVELTGGLTGSATGAGVSQRLEPGAHTMILRSADEASSDLVPFFVTWGLAPEDVEAENCQGLSRIMDLAAEGKTGPSWQWKRQLTVRSLPNSLKLPLTVAQPSVATVATWSSFVQHYVRVALVTEEGLWVGEQRGRRSSLEIELPVGSYQVIVEEMASLSPAPAGCMALGVEVSLAPFSSVEKASAALGAFLGLGAKCDGLGALPLPLDAVSDTGGSGVYGGPMEAGRLLMRERVMLTDIHDGRKKVFLRLPPACMLRVAAVSGDAEETEVVLEDSNHQQIVAVESHIMGVGQAASYVLEAGGGLWLSFHREHREAANAGCASFDLLLQAAPMQDIVKMSACGGDPRDVQAFAAELLKNFQGSSVSSAEGRVLLPGGGSSSAVLHLQLSEAAQVELEVQFNFMLSNVHIWLEAAGSRAAPPAVAAHGLASAARNARAVLRLRLDAGEHILRLRHDPAFPKEAGPVKLVLAGGQCAPLALKLRKSGDGMVAFAPTAPFSSGADVLVQLDAEASPTLAELPPSAAGGAGPVTVAWSAESLKERLGVAGRLVTAVEGASRIWALPLRFRGGDGELWFSLDHKASGRPWSGDAAPPLSAPPALWPDQPVHEPAAHATVLHASSASPALAAAARPTGLSFTRVICWLGVLGLIAYYVHTRPLWFKSLMMRAGLLESPGRFTQFQASEMTTPWSWPQRLPRPAPTSRAYGTLDL